MWGQNEYLLCDLPNRPGKLALSNRRAKKNGSGVRQSRKSAEDVVSIARNAEPVVAVGLFIIEKQTRGEVGNRCLGRAVFHNLDFIKHNCGQMLVKPIQFGFSNALVVFRRSRLGQPRNHAHMVALALKVIQQFSELAHIHEGLCFPIGASLSSNQAIKPTIHAVKIGNRSIHIEVNSLNHFVISPFLL